MAANPYKQIWVGDIRIDEHRYVMQKIIGRKLEFNEVVHHKDGDKFNNDPSNLEVMSRADHLRLHRIGSKTHPATKEKMRITARKIRSRAKLTPEQVFEIDKLLKSGASAIKLAKEYGMCRETFFKIKSGRMWGWLTGNSPLNISKYDRKYPADNIRQDV